MRLKYPLQKIFLTTWDHPAYIIGISHEQWCVAKFPANCSRPLLDGCLLPFTARWQDLSFSKCLHSCLQTPTLQNIFAGFVSPKASSGEKRTPLYNQPMWLNLNRWSWWKGMKPGPGLIFQLLGFKEPLSTTNMLEKGQLHFRLSQTRILVHIDSIIYIAFESLFYVLIVPCASGGSLHFHPRALVFM